jgi:16S rRNA (guanine966-N2)-methyltransferase
MRVVAGSHKGRTLHGPDTPDTRPVTDRVREAVFSSLGAFVEGARVADLYAGAGSFGIEALSRGAETAVFVERGRRALDSLRRNLDELGLEGEIVASDVAGWLRKQGHRFDLVFCDPPWSVPSSELADVLEILASSLDPEALVVVTRRADDGVPHPLGYLIDDERRHGDTRIIRYALENAL